MCIKLMDNERESGNVCVLHPLSTKGKRPIMRVGFERANASSLALHLQRAASAPACPRPAATCAGVDVSSSGLPRAARVPGSDTAQSRASSSRFEIASWLPASHARQRCTSMTCRRRS